MSFQIRGWHSQVVEVAYEEAGDSFWEEMKTDPFLRMFVRNKGVASGGPVMAPMVEGQGESVMWLEVECPAWQAAMVHAALDAALRRSFPRPPAG